MQTLTYLLDPIPVEMIEKGLQSTSPNAIKAFYKSIEMHSSHPISSIENYSIHKTNEFNTPNDNNENNNGYINTLSLDEFKMTPRMRKCYSPSSTPSKGLITSFKV
jgi:hypothetical protein